MEKTHRGDGGVGSLSRADGPRLQYWIRPLGLLKYGQWGQDMGKLKLGYYFRRGGDTATFLLRTFGKIR